MKKHSKKIVSLMLALLMVFSLLPMSSISALAAGSNSPVAVQADDTVTAAPAPVFYSVLTDLSRQSATYYADDSDKVGQLRVQLKYNPSDYNKNTLAILWQVSDDGSTFTDAEGAGTTMSAPLVSTYVPKVTVGQTTWSTTDDCNLLACGWCTCRNRYFIRWCVIYNITLHTTDIDGVINNISAATRLTWMLTDQGTCRRERIVFTDQANCILTASLTCQCNISRNIHMRRAKCDTRDRLFE